MGRRSRIRIARGVGIELAAAGGLLALAVGGALLWPRPLTISLAMLLALAFLLLLRFFRDPERAPDSDDHAAVLAPADGRVVELGWVHEPRFLGGRALKVGIFMSVLDVHVNRAPTPGRVVFVEHVPGRFLQAHRPEAALINEHNWIGLEAPHGRILVNQIAGIMARRINCWVAPGQSLVRGERLGIIKLGSRVEVYLPPGSVAVITKGERVYAGRTVIAEWGPTRDGAEPTPGAGPS